MIFCCYSMPLTKRKIHYYRNRNFLPIGYKTSLSRSAKKMSVSKFLWAMIKDVKWRIFAVLVAYSISTTIDWTLGPIFAKSYTSIISNYTGARADIMDAVWLPITLYLGFWIGTDLLHRIAGWFYAQNIIPTFCGRVITSSFNRIISNSYEFLSHSSTGEQVNIIQQLLFCTECMVKNLAQRIIPIAVACCFLLSSFLFIHWQFFLIIMVYMVGSMVIFFASYNKTMKLQGKMMLTFSSLIGNITDILMNISSVLMFSRRNYEMERMKRIQNYNLKRRSSALTYAELIKTLNVIYCFVTCGLIYILMLFSMYKNGIIELSDIVYCISAMGASCGLIMQLQSEIADFIGDVGRARKNLAMLTQGTIADNIISGGSELQTESNKIGIKIEDLSFQYTRDCPLFEKLNLEIKPGEKLGLAGRSGSGKTSLINLLLRNLSPNSGSITIAGQNIEHLSDESLKQCISIVSQDTTLFNRSVIENIRYSKPDATMDEIIEASKKANAHDFITELENGYYTKVGERGGLLSGGQRQRILIARAILKNSPILILDEATSALDAENEKIINDSLENLMEGKTVIAIAHKLNTLRQMNRIIVLKNGKIVESGKHDELLEKGGVYKTLWQIQTEGMIVE